MRKDIQRKNNKGFTILIAVMMLSAILSVSLGMFTIIFGNLVLSGQTADSQKALYAADQGLERALYRDRQQNVCAGVGACDEANIALPSSACFTVTVNPTLGCAGGAENRCISSIGQYKCGSNVTRLLKRAFFVGYTNP